MLFLWGFFPVNILYQEMFKVQTIKASLRLLMPKEEFKDKLPNKEQTEIKYLTRLTFSMVPTKFARGYPRPKLKPQFVLASLEVPVNRKQKPCVT